MQHGKKSETRPKDWHVLPENDLVPHEDGEGYPLQDCPCDPEIEVVGASLLIIHNAYDGRE